MKQIPDKPLRSLDELSAMTGIPANELEVWWDHQVFAYRDVNSTGFWFSEREVTQALLVWHQP